MIDDVLENNTITKKEHINNLRNYNNSPACPRCGKQMVLRTAKKGPNAGTQFWGCSGFPECKTTKYFE